MRVGLLLSGGALSAVSPMVPGMADEPEIPLGSFPLGALLRTAEENIRQVAERLEARGVLAADRASAAQLADVRLWLLAAAHRSND